ncbi:MAG: hypothetical protein LBS89_08405 [Zoogloeaceae bacterium]|jgi:hypothetical protein|nr:hypothetical protein [Zoogloeaceae bacterium]
MWIIRSLLVLMLLMSAAAFAEDAVQRPGAVRALEVAYQHFAAELAQRPAPLKPRPGSQEATAAFLSSIHNYHITITESGETFEVYFAPKQKMLGGDRTYQLDKQDFRILNVVRGQ